MKQVPVLLLTHSRLSIVLHFIKTFNLKQLEQRLSFSAGVVCIRGNRCPLVPIAKQLPSKTTSTKGAKAQSYPTELRTTPVDKRLADRQGVRQVVKQITSTYWFIREVLKNAPDLVVVSPESVRDRLRQTLRSLCTQYDINIE